MKKIISHDYSNKHLPLMVSLLLLATLLPEMFIIHATSMLVSDNRDILEFKPSVNFRRYCFLSF